MNYIERSTDCGAIRGLEFEDWLEFRGIRYATAERFRNPQPVGPWEGVYNATEFGDCAYQHRAFDDDAVVNPFYHKEFRKGLSFTYSDDCLFLNLWVPKDAKDCPVIIYIHGGSFTGGSANEGHISGVEFARKGVILAAFNYRLGPFGFCAHPDVTEENGACGNQGLFDQTLAIKWVMDHIAAFGGDPKNITLMGQSAGAMSVDIHLANPAFKDRFAGAILISGAGLQRFVGRPLQPKGTIPFWNKIMANAHVDSMEELRGTDARTLYYAWLHACKEDKLSMFRTLPVYDGVLLRKGEFSTRTIPDMPYIIGVTSEDMSPAVLRRLAAKWGKYAARHCEQPCYLYYFTRRLPGDDKGAWHSSDLLYAFSTLDFNWRPFEEIDYRISQQISDAFCAFARTGNPNCDTIPDWKAGGDKVMRFCEDSHMAAWNEGKGSEHFSKNKEG